MTRDEALRLAWAFAASTVEASEWDDMVRSGECAAEVVDAIRTVVLPLMRRGGRDGVHVRRVRPARDLGFAQRNTAVKDANESVRQLVEAREAVKELEARWAAELGHANRHHAALRAAEDRLERVERWETVTSHTDCGAVETEENFCSCCGAPEGEPHLDDCPLHGWTRTT